MHGTIVRLHWARGLRRIELDSQSLRALRREVLKRTGVLEKDQDLCLDPQGARPLEDRYELVSGVQVYLLNQIKGSEHSDDEGENDTDDEGDGDHSNGNDADFECSMWPRKPDAKKLFQKREHMSIDCGALHVFLGPRLAGNARKDVGLLVGKMQGPHAFVVKFVLEDSDLARGKSVARAMGLDVIGCIIFKAPRYQFTATVACAALFEDSGRSDDTILCLVTRAPKKVRAFTIQGRKLSAFSRQRKRGNTVSVPWEPLGMVNVHAQRRAYFRPFRGQCESAAALLERVRQSARDALQLRDAQETCTSDFHFLYSISVLFGDGAVRGLLDGGEAHERQVLEAITMRRTCNLITEEKEFSSR